MRYKVIGAMAFLALAAVSASAHHAVQSVFDFKKPVNVTGVLTKVAFINPHSYVSLDVTDTNGKVVSWTFETLAIGSLRKHGMSKADQGGLRIGEQVSITGVQAADGTNYGFMQTMTLPGGRVVDVRTNDPYANN
jgi:hypothetical protein